MIIELSTGKYLHTAYSITNIPEEMTTLDDEWSLTSQDGMDYIGTFIDGNSTESTDPSDYVWEELVDEDLEDEDEDGDLPVDDFQTQIDELQDQVAVNQDNIRNINASIENVQTNVASNSELSSAIVETGTTSNNWDYRLWSDGTYEAWRSHGFTGMALTSSSAGTYYGGGTTLGVPTFPNNSNTGVTQCLCTASNAFSHSSGVYLYQTEHASATTATSSLTFQFRAHASTSNAACGLDIYLKGTYA